MELDVLALLLEQLEQAVCELVLAHALVPNQQHVLLARDNVLQHLFHRPRVLGDVKVVRLRHQLGVPRRLDRVRHLADEQPPIPLLYRVYDTHEQNKTTTAAQRTSDSEPC